VVVLGAAALSCYGPRYGNCVIACTDGCPDGYTCSNNLCLAVNGDRSACSGSATGDGGTCNGWPFTPSNVDLCATDFPGVGSPYAIASGSASMIDTGGLPPYTFDGTTYAVMHVPSFSIGSNSYVSVSGPAALIVIVEGDVSIYGVLDASGMAPGDGLRCSALAGSGVSSQAATGGGGGGGGYGTPGGDGGAGFDATMTSRGSGGQVALNGKTLTPLTFGCPGGPGGAAGSDGSTSGGLGGFPGGAIQISSRTAIAILDPGSVSANGGGGFGGSPGSGAPFASGGGGGASGGSILLEAMTIDVGSGGSVCALGGGGGAGGTTEKGDVSGGNANTQSGCSQARGATIGGGAGGSGAGAQRSAGTGSDGDSSGSAAGGGGGGEGMICLHGTVTELGTIDPASTCP